jgi:hypothetical protein
MGDAVNAIERVGVEKAVEMSGLPRSTIMGFRSGKKPKFIYERTRKALRALLRYSPKPKPEPAPPKNFTAQDFLDQRAVRKAAAAEPPPEPVEEPEAPTITNVDPLMVMMGRITDALEVSAIALTIIAEKLDE